VRSFRRTLVGAGSAVLLLLALAGPSAANQDTLPWQEVCRFADSRLNEISGMAHSLRHRNLLWVHNDSGDQAVVYGVDRRTCITVSEVRLRGVKARDFEGMAISQDARGRSFLWIGDIGDNRESWSSVSLHRLREPARLGVTHSTPRTWRFTYPDRPRNAESLLVDGKQVWVATWEIPSGGMYRVPLNASVSLARRVGNVGPLITDGAIHPSGKGYVLRDYLALHVFTGSPPGKRLASFALPAQVQGEAIAWTPDGRGLYIASERDDRLIAVELPARVVATLNS